MIWERSDRFDPRAVRMADQHYSRQQPGTNQFMRPGSCLVFYAGEPPRQAVWGTSWQQFAKHLWPGAWECAIFRNEGAGLSSEMIRDAVAATRWHYGDPPEHGMITFVDASKVRHKRDPGRCFVKAGFRPIACIVKSRLLVLQMLAAEMPSPRPLYNRQTSLFGEAA